MVLSLATLFGEQGQIDLLTELPIAVTGSWVKDGHRFSITKEDLDDIVKNFDKRGNGEVVVDYEHASERPEVARGGAVPAAGWITSMSVKDNDDGKGSTLYANIDFVDDAKEHIKKKRYKYFSPAIDWGAVDKKTGRGKGATVTSGALTNHPFLEELPALSLSDRVLLGEQKQIVVPVVDNAKIKVKIDSKHDDDKEDMADVSLDQKRRAISDAIQKEYGGSPGATLGQYPWVKEVFDDYAIVESDGKLWKCAYSMDKKSNVELEKPVQVQIEYVEASELSLADLHGLVLADDKDNTKEGVAKEDYAFVGDPDKKGTWKYKVDTPGRVRNALARWGQHKGIPKDKEPGVLRKIMQRAKKHGIKVDKSNPKYKVAAAAVAAFDLKLEDGFLSEVPMKVKMTDIKYGNAILGVVELMEHADKDKELCAEIRAILEGDDPDMKVLSEKAVKLLDDIDEYGIEGDRDMQDKLRKEAEGRAAKIDDPSDDDETEELTESQLADMGIDPKKSGKADGKPSMHNDKSSKNGVPRFAIRKMRSEDKAGKMGHYAVVSPSGKLTGYISSGDLMNAAKMAGVGKAPGTMKASDADVEEFIQQETGRRLTMAETVKLVEVGINAGSGQQREKARKVLMSEAMTDGKFDHRKARRLLANEKISMADYADFEDAVEDVDKAINEGRFLPRQRGSLVALCLADRDAFVKLCGDQPQSRRTESLGLRSGTEEGMTAQQEVIQKTEKYMTDHKEEKLTYGAALSRVLASDAQLKDRYDKETRKQLM